MQFNYASDEYPPINKSAHLKADNNLSYLEIIDLIKYLWEKGHPDVEFVPASSNGISSPDKGYIVYGLEGRSATKDYAKARPIEMIRDTESGKDIEVWMQSFDNFVSFASVHRDPRVSEEIIEAFEDFMIESTPVLKSLGVGELLYSRRYPDREDARIGEDMCVRTVVYRIMIQKIRKVEHDLIEKISIDVRVWLRNQQQYPLNQATPNIELVITDQATPNT
jgi:hypothetical protein